MSTDSEKLAAIAAIVQGVEPVSAGEAPAYDLPSLTADEAIKDGVTWNRDGSLWVMVTSQFSPTPNVREEVKTPARTFYGYISRKKTPWMWIAAHRFLTAPQFEEWDATWKASPFTVRHSILTKEAAENPQTNLLQFSAGESNLGPEIIPK